jgi:benzoyl-CoA 2,3-dioxygenase component B
MKPVHEQGKIANWIAPPKKGINSNEFEFEYVKL